MAIAECTACGETFNGVTYFDAHQDYDDETTNCTPPTELGLIKNERGYWKSDDDFDWEALKRDEDLIRTCRDCDREFKRPRKRGRPPTRCPRCR